MVEITQRNWQVKIHTRLSAGNVRIATFSYLPFPTRHDGISSVSKFKAEATDTMHIAESPTDY
jgi:hypothetical protein